MVKFLAPLQLPPAGGENKVQYFFYMEYIIRRSPRAKRIRLSLNPSGEVTLVLPRFVPELVGRQFAKAQWKWVERQRKKLPPVISSYQQTHLGSGSELVFFDQKKYSIKIFKTSKKRDRLKLAGEVLELYLGSTLEPEQPRLRALVEKFYKQQARDYLTQRAEYWAAQLGVKFNDLRIKNTTSRWGSCSSKGNLNFNWRIMLAPSEVVDYLVIHEVCHLKEMNHSPRFWALVESLDSDFKQHERYLKSHQHRLLLFLAPPASTYQPC